MKKVIFAVAVLGLISFNALAADNGFYAGVQGGYGEIGDLAPSTSSVMDAVNSDLTANNNLGDVYDIHQSTLKLTSGSSSASASNPFAGRLFIGYQFNPYLAIEAGYTKYFEDIKVQSQLNGTGQIEYDNDWPPQNYNNISATVNVANQESENVADLVAKIIIPIPNSRFNVYTKIGAAYVDPSVSTTVQSVSVNAPGLDSSHIYTNTSDIQANANMGVSGEFCPEVSPGISYDITSHLTADASWTFIKGVGDVQNVNFGSVGLTYHFA